MAEFAVTGANGFVGARLCHRLLARGKAVRACVRNAQDAPNGGAELRLVSDLRDAEQWRDALDGIECVVHLAARVHDMSGGDLEAYRAVNVEGSRAVVAGAVANGVRRLIFLSTIKVNGESTSYDRPFSSADPPHPSDAYAISKWEAEQLIREEADKRNLETVIIRPVLVYGPGVRANFLRLLRLIEKGYPLPLGSVRNRRSVLYLDNLCDLIEFSAGSVVADGRVLLAADETPLSTPQLLRLIGKSMGRRVILIGIPPGILLALAKVAGRAAEAHRLFDSLYVDTEWMGEIGWAPPVSTEDGLEATMSWFMERRNA